MAEQNIATRLTLEGAAEFRLGLAETGAALEQMGKRAKELKAEYNLLVQAQKETGAAGELSVKTLAKMMEKFPALCRYLEETAEGYRLTDGALQDYIGTQRAEYELAYNNASSAAEAIVNAEVQKRGAIVETTQGIKEQLKALAALYDTTEGIAANFGEDYRNSDDFYAHGSIVAGRGNAIREALAELERSEREFQVYDRTLAMLERDSASGGSGKRGGSSSSSKGQPQAERDLEAYRAAVKELDHQRAMDELSEEDYYRQKNALAELYLKENLEEYQKWQEELHDWQKGAYDRERSDLEEALENESITTEEYLSGLLKLRNDHLEEGSAAWEDATRKHQEEMKRLNQAAYSEELADLDYFQDMGLVSEEEYYARLAELRDRYLEEDSEAWRAANAKIHNWEVKKQEEALAAAQRAYQAQLDALEDAYKERLDQLKDALEEEKDALADAYKEKKEAAKAAYDEKKAAIQAELALEKERLNAVIDGIDAEIQARKELREDEDQDDAIAAARKRLEAAQAQREYARTDEDRAEWEKEVVRLREALEEAIQDKEDTAFYREKDAEKEAVKGQISAAEDAAKGKQDQASRDYEATLERLEDDYEAALERAQEAYEQALKQARKDYNSAVSGAGGGGGSGGSGGGGGSGGKEMDPRILAIAKENNVEYSVAEAMDYANKKYQGDPDYTPYSDGGYRERAAREASELGAMAGAVLAGAARTFTREVSSVTNKSSSANVNIYEARALTEGEIERSVRKVLNVMDR